jgi:hypothetical protein
MKIIKVFFLSVCALAGLVCQAQEPGFLVGVEGGGGLSTLRGNQMLNNLDPLLGYTGGLWAQYDFKRFFSLKTGAYYDLKGASDEVTMTDAAGNKLGTFKASQNFNYVSVPLLARLHFGKKVEFFINTGPYMGILLKQTLVFGSTMNNPGGKLDGTDNFKKTEFGISMGIGMSFTLDRMVLSVEARDNLGLTNTSKLVIYNGESIKTNAANLVFGIGYKLGGTKANGTK